MKIKFSLTCFGFSIVCIFVSSMQHKEKTINYKLKKERKIKMETNYLKKATDFLTKVGATVKIKFLKYDKHFRDDKDCRNIYRVTIRKDGKSISFNFGDSIRSTIEGTEPNAYDVLACLEKYDVGTFEDFCSEFGYDEEAGTPKGLIKQYAKNMQACARCSRMMNWS